MAARLFALFRDVLVGRPAWLRVADYDRFDRDARRILHEANRAARRLDHEYISTEHLLLGILSVPGAAMETLRTAGLEPDDLRADFERLLVHGPASNPCRERRIVTPTARVVLALAVDESKRFGQGSAGPADLLIGLVLEPQGIAGDFFRQLRVDVGRLRKARNKTEPAA